MLRSSEVENSRSSEVGSLEFQQSMVCSKTPLALVSPIYTNHFAYEFPKGFISDNTKTYQFFQQDYASSTTTLIYAGLSHLESLSLTLLLGLK